MKNFIFIISTILSTLVTAQTAWLKIPSGTNKKLNCIDFPSSKVGYIGGNDSTLLKSTDGGYTWKSVKISGVKFMIGGEHILKLDFVSETIGYMIAGPYGAAYKTIDGGSTWTQVVPAGNMCFFGALYFFDDKNGFIGGSNCFQGESVDKMTNGSLSTTQINSPTWDASNRVVDIDFLNNNFGLGVSKSGNVIRTTDGGLHWDSIPTNVPDGTPLTSVAVINNTLAYAGYDSPGQGFGLLRSMDGGLTWADDMGSATFYYPDFLCVHESGNGTVYSGARPSFGKYGLIFENVSGTWSFNQVDQPINSMSSYTGNVVFGVGDSGLVVVNKLSTVSISEKVFGGRSVRLYPNPVNGVLNVSVGEGVALERVNVSVISLSGQVLYSRVCSDDFLVDVSRFERGIYLLEVRSGDFCGRELFVKE